MITNRVSCVHLCPVDDLFERISANCCVLLVDVFDLNHRIWIDAVIRPIQINTMCAGYMTHCRTSAFVHLFSNGFVVFEDL